MPLALIHRQVVLHAFRSSHWISPWHLEHSFPPTILLLLLGRFLHCDFHAQLLAPHWEDPDVHRCTLEDAQEAAMVRHEAAEALGSIADDASLQLLQDYLADPEPIVADSCAVALDMAAHERSGKFQYADVAT